MFEHLHPFSLPSTLPLPLFLFVSLSLWLSANKYVNLVRGHITFIVHKSNDHIIMLLRFRWMYPFALQEHNEVEE